MKKFLTVLLLIANTITIAIGLGVLFGENEELKTKTAKYKN